MIKSLLLKLKGNSFVQECMLFRSNFPYYWFLGIVVWGSLIVFVYAGLALIRLSV